MSYERNISAISFGDLKAAALYFDRVVPVAFRSLRGDKSGLFLDAPEPVPVSTVVKLIFGDHAPRHLVISYLDDYWSPFIESLDPLLRDRRDSTDPEAYTELKRVYMSGGGNVRARFGEFAARLGIPSYSVLLPQREPTASLAEAYSCLALAELPLVDTSAASWDQIMELRASPEARIHLRRLRLFFFENYSGKSPAYIEDDLLRRLDDYDRVRRQFGFRAITSSMSVLLDSRSIQASAVAAITAAMFGGPIAGLSAGAAVEIGKLILEAGTKRAEIRDLAQGHELGYLIQARKRTE